ncbi:EF-1 alpha-like protein, partial [Haematococcus lacustris]
RGSLRAVQQTLFNVDLAPSTLQPMSDLVTGCAAAKQCEGERRRCPQLATVAPITMATDGKQHLSIVICGHVDSGKSTTTGRLIFELGGIPERELAKLKEEADRLGKS